MRFAIVKNGVVENIVEADQTLATAKGWIRTDSAGPGWLFDGRDFRDSTPPKPPPGPSQRDVDLVNAHAKIDEVINDPSEKQKLKDVFIALRKIL
jgi:hypothetical protein